MSGLAHEVNQDLDFLRSYHDGDNRFMVRFDRIASYIEMLQDSAIGLDVRPTAEVVEIPAVEESGKEVGGGELNSTKDLLNGTEPINEAEAIRQADTLLAEVPEEIGGKKKRK